jgi:hypothetical protein
MRNPMPGLYMLRGASITLPDQNDYGASDVFALSDIHKSLWKKW